MTQIVQAEAKSSPSSSLSVSDESSHDKQSEDIPPELTLEVQKPIHLAEKIPN